MNIAFGSDWLIYLAFMMEVFITKIKADFEVCNPGSSTAVYQFIRENCPFGVLFDHPITVTCLASTNYPYVRISANKFKKGTFTSSSQVRPEI